MIRSVAPRSDQPDSEAFSPPEPARERFGRAIGRIPPYLSGLNAEQLAAVEALDGPVLVLAGAGVGKTRVLTTRIAHLIASGRARAHEILAVTFTNKAAREMRERVSVFTGAHQGMPWLGTFHSIGVKILRMHAELVALRPNFTILDTDDQLRLLKQVLQAENLDDKRWPARALASLIDGWKNRGLDPAHVPASESLAFAAGRGAALYAAYQARLKTLNAVDFGDLLLEALQALSRASRRARRLPAPVPLHPGRRVPGHQRRPVSVAPAAGAGRRQYLLRRRRRPVDLRLARRRRRQHPAVRDGLSRREGHPPRAQLPLGRPHPGGRLGAHRP